MVGRTSKQKVGGTGSGQRISPQWISRLLSIPALFLAVLLTYVVLGGILFGLAGRVDLPWVWAALSTMAASHLALAWFVLSRDPDLARERLKPGPGVPAWDKLILASSSLLMLASLVAAAFDLGRTHWTDSVPPLIQFAGLIGIAIGMLVMAWAMAANTFFSKAVRIQEERGHRVVQTGPYRFVRHPGYVAWFLLWLSFNLALGSWLAVGIALLMVILIVVRTALEDRFLRSKLDGYAEYASRVRWRLVPGIW